MSSSFNFTPKEKDCASGYLKDLMSYISIPSIWQACHQLETRADSIMSPRLAWDIASLSQTNKGISKVEHSSLITVLGKLGRKIQDHPQIDNNKVILSYMRPCLKMLKKSERQVNIFASEVV